MTNYVWKVKDPSGRSVVREMAANSAAEAKAQLEAEGCTDLALMEGDVAAATVQSFEPVRMFGEEVSVTAEARIKGSEAAGWSTTGVILRVLLQGWGISIGLLALAAFGMVQHRYTMVVSAVVGFSAWIAFIIFVSLPLVLYKKLVHAYDWHRWNDVVMLADKLDTITRMGFIKVPAFDVSRRRAGVVAATGRLDEAIRTFQIMENRPGCPSWLHKAFMAGFCDLAKQHDRAIEYSLASVAEKPRGSAQRDLANRYLRYKKDTAKARAVLAAMDDEPLEETAKPWDKRCRGILALLEGDLTLARQNLEEAIDLMNKPKHALVMEGTRNVAKAYLCCTLARQGDLASARKLLAEAKPYLVATSEHELLRDCEQLVA